MNLFKRLRPTCPCDTAFFFNLVNVSGPVVIVGAGISGLACANTLQEAGRPFLLLEKSDAPGGRIATDHYEGFKLDRGFQVLLTAYPEAEKALDYPSLKLRNFYNGSRVWFQGRFHTLADPFRNPIAGIASIANPIGSFADKLKVGLLRTGLISTKSIPHEVPTIQALDQLGFSNSMIERFWRPFMGGVFLENDLHTSVRKFEETFRFFSKGGIALPEDGIGAIPRQIAGRLPPKSIRYQEQVVKVSQNSVSLRSGEKIQASAVVLATDFEQASLLTNSKGIERDWNSVECLYFKIPQKWLPENKPILLLNGEGEGPVNNLSFLSNLTSCAPSGWALASATILGRREESDGTLVEEAITQMKRWFGPEVRYWEFLRRYSVSKAIPIFQKKESFHPVIDNIFRCGDYMGTPSIDSALKSGREAAESILNSKLIPTRE